MGKIRAVSAMTNSMKDVALQGLRPDPQGDGDRTRPATGRTGRDGEIDSIAEFDQAPDSSRSRGFGRYEI
jgi:hypothetical protein